MPFSLKPGGAYVERDVLESKEKRAALRPTEQFFRYRLRTSRTLAYRMRLRGGAWYVVAPVDGSRRVRMIGLADDIEPCDGMRVLSFEQALARAEGIFSGDIRQFFSKQRLDLIPRTLRVSPIGDRYTVGHALRDYLVEKKARGTKAGYGHAVADANAYIVGDLSSIPCDELNIDDLRRWFHSVTAKSDGSSNFVRRAFNSPLIINDADADRKARGRANSVLICLKAALNMAWRDGKIDRDVAWRRLSPYRGVKKARMRIVTPDEVNLLLGAAHPDLGNLILGGLYTGCRAGELRELRPSNFNYKAGLLFVHGTKTGRSRQIVLSYEAISFFERLTHGLGEGHPIFHMHNLQPWPKSSYTRMMRQASGNAELTPPVVFHDLRHTYASNLIMAGVSPFVIADQLGHADCTQVIKTYGHISAEFAVEQIRKRSPLIIATEEQVRRTAKWHTTLNARSSRSGTKA